MYSCSGHTQHPVCDVTDHSLCSLSQLVRGTAFPRFKSEETDSATRLKRGRVGHSLLGGQVLLLPRSPLPQPVASMTDSSVLETPTQVVCFFLPQVLKGLSDVKGAVTGSEGPGKWLRPLGRASSSIASCHPLLSERDEGQPRCRRERIFQQLGVPMAPGRPHSTCSNLLANCRQQQVSAHGGCHCLRPGGSLCPPKQRANQRGRLARVTR